MLLLKNMCVAVAAMVLIAFTAPSAMAGKVKPDPLAYAAQCSNEIRAIYDEGLSDIQACVDRTHAKIEAQYAMNVPRSEMIRTATKCIAQLEQTAHRSANQMQRMIDVASKKLTKAGASDEIVGIVTKHEINVHFMEDEVLDQAVAQIVDHLNSIIHQPTVPTP